MLDKKEVKNGVFFEYTGKEGENINLSSIDIIYLESNGDFLMDESINLLKQSDTVVTNPPFSLFTHYVSQLIKYDKKFLII